MPFRAQRSTETGLMIGSEWEYGSVGVWEPGSGDCDVGRNKNHTAAVPLQVRGGNATDPFPNQHCGIIVEDLMAIPDPAPMVVKATVMLRHMVASHLQRRHQAADVAGSSASGG